jgi:hypothetical protein
MPMKSVQHYEQVSYKAPEDKARKAVFTFMNNAGMTFNEVDRVIKDGEKVVAEWEGVFEVDDGQDVYFLECKHRVRAVSTSLFALEFCMKMGRIYQSMWASKGYHFCIK